MILNKIPDKTRKMAFQLANVNNKLPKEGAKIGDTPRIKIINDMTLGRSFSSNVSRIIAFGATIPTLPPSAWNKRKMVNASTDGAKAQAMELNT
jgi:aspartate carbamoyltransferase catalytic subunit